MLRSVKPATAVVGCHITSGNAQTMSPRRLLLAVACAGGVSIADAKKAFVLLGATGDNAYRPAGVWNGLFEAWCNGILERSPTDLHVQINQGHSIDSIHSKIMAAVARERSSRVSYGAYPLCLHRRLHGIRHSVLVRSRASNPNGTSPISSSFMSVHSSVPLTDTSVRI